MDLCSNVCIDIKKVNWCTVVTLEAKVEHDSFTFEVMKLACLVSCCTLSV